MQTIYVRKLLAPIVFSLFAIGWYKFSEIYLVNADKLALSNGNYAVYIVPQQLNAYLTDTLWICYVLVFVGLALFWYNLVRVVQQLENTQSKYGLIDVISPIAIALEIIGFIALGNQVLGLSMGIRISTYTIVLACLMWFWYALVKYVRVMEVAG